MLERIDITVGRADLARAAREGPERVLRRVLLGQGLARPDAAADVNGCFDPTSGGEKKE